MTKGVDTQGSSNPTAFSSSPFSKKTWKPGMHPLLARVRLIGWPRLVTMKVPLIGDPATTRVVLNVIWSLTRPVGAATGGPLQLERTTTRRVAIPAHDNCPRHRINRAHRELAPSGQPFRGRR